jgi:hypothetical protein
MAKIIAGQLLLSHQDSGRKWISRVSTSVNTEIDPVQFYPLMFGNAISGIVATD